MTYVQFNLIDTTQPIQQQINLIQIELCSIGSIIVDGVTIEVFTCLPHLTAHYDASNNKFIKYVNYICLTTNYYTQSLINTLRSTKYNSVLYYINSIYATTFYVDNGDQLLLGYINLNFYPNIQCDAKYYTKSSISFKLLIKIT